MTASHPTPLVFGRRWMAAMGHGPALLSTEASGRCRFQSGDLRRVARQWARRAETSRSSDERNRRGPGR
jgi:hypothetical protein